MVGNDTINVFDNVYFKFSLKSTAQMSCFYSN